MITCYFVAYVIGFGSIIDKGFLTLEFFIFFVISIVILFLFFWFKKSGIKIEFTKGTMISRTLLFVGTISLHIYSAIMGQILGPTRIQSVAKGFLETSVKTNAFLVKLNIALLIGFLLISIIVGILIDKKRPHGQNYLKNYGLQLLLIIILIIINFVLFPIISTILFLFQFAHQ